MHGKQEEETKNVAGNLHLFATAQCVFVVVLGEDRGIKIGTTVQTVARLPVVHAPSEVSPSAVPA